LIPMTKCCIQRGRRAADGDLPSPGLVQGRRGAGLWYFLLVMAAASWMVLACSEAALRGQSSPTIPSGAAASPARSGPPVVRIDLDQAIQLALAHDHALQAARTMIEQSRAQEITASLRPNPMFTTDAMFIPFFSPSSLNGPTLDSVSEFDAGISYLIERGHKRQARIRAARDQTSLTEAIVRDNERALTYSVAQQFIQVLLAKSTLQFAQQDLASFTNTVSISEEQYKAGDISEGDFLKTKLQLLQFQTDVSAAQVALIQAKAGLRQLTGYDALPANYDVIGDLAYSPLRLNQMDLEAKALQLRPDLLAAKAGVTAADSQYSLAKADGKHDLDAQINYTHVSSLNNASMFATIAIPLFDRNQGEIARTHYAITQSQQTEQATSDQVLTDVQSAFAAFQTGAQVVELYQSGYLKQARESRDISQYAYRRGAASLLDFLDAERSYRATELAYRQALAAYMTAVEQLRAAVGTRNLP
jgi:cobalt-zinc-cadmium efflux system outer membrane protein